MNFNDIPFETGDIILFHGAVCGPGNCGSHFLSCLIETCTRSAFSHCGVVIKDPLFTPEPLKGLYILESTGLDHVLDVENKENKFGVQLRYLEDAIRNYDGKVYWRQLNCYRNQAFYQKITNAHSVVHNRPYDDGFDYIKALFDWAVGDVQRKDTFFCSALVAFVFVVLGFLPKTTKWSIITPEDFSFKNQTLKWQNCDVLEEIKILF